MNDAPGLEVISARLICSAPTRTGEAIAKPAPTFFAVLAAPTPNTAPILNKKSLTDNKDYLQAIGISPYQPSSSQNLFPTPPRTPADQFWNGGSITRGQLNYIRQQGGSEEYTGWNAQAYGTIVDDPSPENIKWRHIRDAESQAILQGIITEDERTREYE